MGSHISTFGRSDSWQKHAVFTLRKYVKKTVLLQSSEWLRLYIYIHIRIYIYCEQFDPCSGLSLLIVVPVMLVVQGNVTAWRSENGLFPRARLEPSDWQSMHNCLHAQHVQLLYYLVPFRTPHAYGIFEP